MPYHQKRTGFWNYFLVILVSGLLLAGYGGWMAPSHWGAVPALMVLAYPVVATVALVMGLVWLLTRRWRLAVVMLAAVLATWPSLRSNFPVNFSNHDVDSSACFTVLSYNVAAFEDSLWTDTSRMHPVMQQILDIDADLVVMIQPETYGKPYDKRKSIQPWTQDLEQHYRYRTRSSHDGVEFLSKYPFSHKPLSMPECSLEYFPYLIRAINRYAFDVNMNGKQLRVIGAYMTSFQLDDDQRRVLDTTNYAMRTLPGLYRRLDRAFTLREHAAKDLRDSLDASPANVILCTDLNDVPQSYAWRTILGDDLHDAYGECHTGYANTFNAHHMLFHIDHILYRGNLRAVAFERLPLSGSDHYPIIARFVWQ